MNRLAPPIHLRLATGADAADIARILRAALSSFDWMPVLHTPEEDLSFVRGVLIPDQTVTVATKGGVMSGFIALEGEWVSQLYLDPSQTGQGIGKALLDTAIAGMPRVRLYCFQANTGARRFYEREGFCVETLGDGSQNEEGLPDILYLRERGR